MRPAGERHENFRNKDEHIYEFFKESQQSETKKIKLYFMHNDLCRGFDKNHFF